MTENTNRSAMAIFLSICFSFTAQASLAQQGSKSQVVGYDIVPAKYSDWVSSSKDLEQRLDALESSRESQHKSVLDFLEVVYTAISESRPADVAKYFTPDITSQKGWFNKIIEKDNFQSIEIYSLRPDAVLKVIELRALLRTMGLADSAESRYVFLKLLPAGKDSFKIMNSRTDKGVAGGIFFSEAPRWPAYRPPLGAKIAKEKNPMSLQEARPLARVFVKRFYSYLRSGNYFLAESLIDDRLFRGDRPQEWNEYDPIAEKKELEFYNIRSAGEDLISVDVWVGGNADRNLVLKPDRNTGYRIVILNTRLQPLKPDPLADENMVTGDELLTLAKNQLHKFIDETVRLLLARDYDAAELRFNPELVNRFAFGDERKPWEMRKFVTTEGGSGIVGYVDMNIANLKLDKSGRYVEAYGRMEYTTREKNIVFAKFEYDKTRGFRFVDFVRGSYNYGLWGVPGVVADYVPPGFNGNIYKD